MKVLYVTSFNERLYNLSGLKLIYDFINLKMNGDLLVCHENVKINYNLPKNIILYDLSKNDFLNSWLSNNKDIIPIKYGGLHDGNYIDDVKLKLNTSFKKLNIYHKNKVLLETPNNIIIRRYDNIINRKSMYKEIDVKLNKIYDSASKFNCKASLFFRKIASLNYAIEKYKVYDYIIWLDCDCEIIKPFDNNLILELFKDSYCFYGLGNYRKLHMLYSIESSVIGFKKNDGFILLQKIIDSFKTNDFKKYVRWDDGHVMAMIILNDNVKSIDINEHINVDSVNVMEYNILKNYIIHKKGKHHSIEKENRLKINFNLYDMKLIELLK